MKKIAVVNLLICTGSFLYDVLHLSSAALVNSIKLEQIAFSSFVSLIISAASVSIGATFDLLHEHTQTHANTEVEV